jgi:hypothetical protein
MSPELADRSYAMLVNQRDFTPEAKLDIEGCVKYWNCAAYEEIHRALAFHRLKSDLLARLASFNRAITNPAGTSVWSHQNNDSTNSCVGQAEDPPSASLMWNQNIQLSPEGN